MEKLRVDLSRQCRDTDCDSWVYTDSYLAEKPAPRTALLLLVAWIFLAEVCYMLLADSLPEMSNSIAALTDATILLLCLSPAYFVLYRPLRNSWDKNRLHQQEIRRLNHQLLTASENERRQLARNLHDEFGQILTGLQIEIQLVKQDVGGDPETARTQCDWISQQLTGLSGQVRDISRTLRPIMLDTTGLAATLRWLIKTVASHQPQLRFQLQIPEGRLSAQLETVLYRLCQEAINNICKHSRAQQVTIELNLSQEWVTLSVIDDGCGFDLPAVEKSAGEAGLGLIGMRERVAACCGKLQILTRPDEGCMVSAQIPLAQKELP